MNQAYIYDAVRTPFGRFGGALAGVRPDDLAADELSRVLAGFPRRYLTAVDAAQIYRLVRLARDLSTMQ